MEYEFIALDKCGEEVKWLCYFLEDILRWSKTFLQFGYIAIGNLLLVEHKTVYISLDIFVVDKIPSNNYSRLGYIFKLCKVQR